MGAPRTHTMRYCLELLEQRRLLSFSPAVDYPAGASPAGVATADFNRDGRPDVAVANADNVSVHLANPNGSFQPAQQHAGGAWPQNIAVADFNADGKMDIVTGHNAWGASGVAVLLGNGDGMFQPVGIVSGYLIHVSVVVGDFNSDGKPDVLASGLDGSEGAVAQLSLLVGHGDGTFTPQYPIDIRVGSAIALTAGDFNGDGKLDVAGNGYEGAIVLFGDGAGGFSPSASQQSASQQSAPPVWLYGLSVVAGDLNADGKPDLVFGDQATNQNGLVTVYHGGGDGTFLYSQRLEVGPNPASLIVVDVNRDGRLDLVAASRGIHDVETGISVGGSVSVLLGNSDGTLQAAQEFMPDSQSYSVAAVDFNSDAFPDLALLRRSSLGNVSVLLNDGIWDGKSWIGPASGSWSAAENWSPSGVPAPGDHVSIAGKSVNLGSNATVASLTLTGGASLTVSGNGNCVLRTSSLSVATDSTLDLTDNDLIVDYTGASPAAAVEARVRSGYNSGNWSGTGITSSTAAADGNFTLAVADNALLPSPFGSAQGGPLFSGVDVDLTSVLVKFTHRADVDLDGLITPNDAAIFGGNYSDGDFANWGTGDMDYDGLFTPTDAAIFGGFYDESLPLL